MITLFLVLSTTAIFQLTMSSKHVFTVHSLAWDAISSIASKIVPPLTSKSYKGQMGKVGVLGGSRDYTGAPFYAASAALKFGADLSYVYCAEEAAIPIKSYSPELMVTPFYSATSHMDREIVPSAFSRMNTLVIGPGLGRDPQVSERVEYIIRQAISNNLM